MSENSYHFDFSPLPEDDRYLPQISAALEDLTNARSRKRMPGLWKLTDRLNAMPKVSETVQRRRRIRYRIYGVLFILAGIFLTVPGLMKPKELFVPLLTGLFALFSGITYLRLFGTQKKKNHFDKPAARLLANRRNADTASAAAVFTDTGLLISADEEEEHVPYAAIERICCTEDLFLVIYAEKVLLLQKQDLAEHSPEAFTGFLTSRDVTISDIS